MTEWIKSLWFCPQRSVFTRNVRVQIKVAKDRAR